MQEKEKSDSGIQRKEASFLLNMIRKGYLKRMAVGLGY